MPSLIIPSNIRDVASFVHSNATIRDRAVTFGSGISNDVLLVIPLACPGEPQPYSSIQITVGLDDSTLTGAGVDVDLRIGLIDGQRNLNQFVISDVNKYNTQPPCSLLDGVQDDNRVSGMQAPVQVTFVFTPSMRFGACYTAQDGGFGNSGTFNAQVDLMEGVFLIVQRGDADEEYRLYYFQVEFLQ